MLEFNSLFDEKYYLLQNQDVAIAIGQGFFSSGLDHYQRCGQFERRSPSGFFAEDYYLFQNSDVAQAVQAGLFQNGLQHFISNGQAEGRQSSVFFDPNFYLGFYSDVDTAVANSSLTPLEHFIKNGQFEQRDPFSEFYTDTYLTENPDVAQAVQATAATTDPLTPIEHFIDYGQYEGRNFGPDFNNSSYLQQNPDVAAAVRPFGLSPIKHYLQFGKDEGRFSTEGSEFNTIDLTQALDLGTIGSATVSDFVGNNNTVDVYRFNVGNLSTVNITLNGLSADADLTLIEDSNNNGVLDEFETLDVSIAEGAAPEEISSLLSSGSYYVLVEQFEGDTNYNLSLSAIPFTPASDTAGNTLNEARDLGTLSGSQTLNEFVGNVDTQDIYRFALSSSSNLNVSLQDLSADADLQLIQDTNGNGIVEENEAIESSTSLNNASEAIAINALPAGTYFIAVNQYEGDTTYNLSLSASPPISRPARTADSSVNDAEVNNSAVLSKSGQVNATNPENDYSFTVNESGIFTANLTGLTGDADVRLIRDFNGNGKVDSVADRNGNGFIDNDEIEVVAWQWERGTASESIRAFLQPATYVLQVKSFNQQTADYTVNSNFTPEASDPWKFSIELNFGQGTEDLTEAERNTVRQAARRIEQLISYSTFNGPHTIKIDTTAEDQGEYLLASAGPEQNQADLNRKSMPIIGEASLNSNPQSAVRANQRYLYDTMIHEFGHVMGIGTLWDDRKLIVDPKVGRYNPNSYAGIYYGELLGAFSATPVELTVGQGKASDLAHWNKIPNFDIEIMVESGDKSEQQLTSQLTIAALRDLGYNVNYGAAEEYRLPSNNPLLIARQQGNSPIS
ncbi:hypothetical protein NIES2119_09800 [[Phormidium ambiguum] IAM M-71]|uniref:Peptidase C-terminal archaeal/bacterial domain-containing protein n=1 Tax=[Phormidium ambiguum] IAM M-71 TaxID=454136 RepID=A0A1U7IM56_9CYAN|nr:PPC domain-containing protein [Phormidium ambiguum]OKH38321.1 hypothetical protein NIES2119_09800 [Phormidium ambiguum IAM M-71]